RTELGAIYRDVIWATFDGVIPQAEKATSVKAALRRSLDTVTVAGSRLNSELRNDQQIARALQYVEDNGQAGAVITVVTDDIFLPWELLYPGNRTANMTEAQKDASPVEVRRFWGARLALHQ